MRKYTVSRFFFPHKHHVTCYSFESSSILSHTESTVFTCHKHVTKIDNAVLCKQVLHPDLYIRKDLESDHTKNTWWLCFKNQMC